MLARDAVEAGVGVAGTGWPVAERATGKRATLEEPLDGVWGLRGAGAPGVRGAAGPGFRGSEAI